MPERGLQEFIEMCLLQFNPSVMLHLALGTLLVFCQFFHDSCDLNSKVSVLNKYQYFWFFHGQVKLISFNTKATKLAGGSSTWTDL